MNLTPEETQKKLDKALKRNLESQTPKPEIKKEEVVLNETSGIVE